MPSNHRAYYLLAIVAEPWKVSKKIVTDLLSPLRDIVTIVDSVADIHPALKVCFDTSLIIMSRLIFRIEVVAGIVKVKIGLSLGYKLAINKPLFLGRSSNGADPT